LPGAAKVSLNIYDVSGRLVRTLVSGEMVDSGPGETVWPGRDETGRQVAAGVYFYRLEAGDFIETKRMTLVK
jgi:flagellar hook assembly protein FlgD